MKKNEVQKILTAAARATLKSYLLVQRQAKRAVQAAFEVMPCYAIRLHECKALMLGLPADEPYAMVDVLFAIQGEEVVIGRLDAPGGSELSPVRISIHELPQEVQLEIAIAMTSNFSPANISDVPKTR